jgi:hypothetical protein
MEYTKNGVLVFGGQKGLKCEIGRTRLENFLKAHIYDIWK